MADEQQIRPEVKSFTAALDDERVQQRSSYIYARDFWDSYKGHYRGWLGGLAIGGLISAGIGVSVVALLPAAAIGTVSAAAIIGGFTAVGGLMVASGFGSIGAAAASRATGLAEKHARILDPEYADDRLGALDDKLMVDGRGNHYEFPKSRDKGKFFSWKSGLTGTVIGSVSGLVLAKVGALTGASAIFSHLAGLTSVVGGTAATAGVGGLLLNPVGLGIIACGIIGLTFGINRSIFKTIFNHTDANIRGEIRGTKGPDLGQIQERGHEQGSELLQHRLRRQQEVQYLEKEYNDRIFWGAVSGRFRGYAGGMATGAIIGALAGAAAFAVAAVAGIFSAPGLALLGSMMVIFAGAGALFSEGIFPEVGSEAGAEATARAIDNEFERNQILKAKGITPAVPVKGKSHWFSLKSALYVGAVGALVGLAIEPYLIAALVGAGGLFPGLHIAGFTGYALSSLICGGVGVSYGIGTSTEQAIVRGTDWIYNKSYAGPPDVKPQAIFEPAISKSSPYAEITAEDMAKLNTALNATSEKSFAKTVSQQMQAPSTQTVGA